MMVNLSQHSKTHTLLQQQAVALKGLACNQTMLNTCEIGKLTWIHCLLELLTADQCVTQTFI